MLSARNRSKSAPISGAQLRSQCSYGSRAIMVGYSWSREESLARQYSRHAPGGNRPVSILTIQLRSMTRWPALPAECSAIVPSDALAWALPETCRGTQRRRRVCQRLCYHRVGRAARTCGHHLPAAPGVAADRTRGVIEHEEED